jgi:hypothetical protein
MARVACPVLWTAGDVSLAQTVFSWLPGVPFGMRRGAASQAAVIDGSGYSQIWTCVGWIVRD